MDNFSILITSAAWPWCLDLMCDAIPVLLVSLAAQPSLPLLIFCEQCRHWTMRKSPEINLVLNHESYRLQTIYKFVVSPPRAPSLRRHARSEKVQQLLLCKIGYFFQLFNCLFKLHSTALHSFFAMSKEY